MASTAARRWSASTGVGLVGETQRQGVREPQVHGQGDEVLLRPVVDVALEQAAGLVLRVDDPLTGSPELVGPCRQLGQPLAELHAQGRAAQDETCLTREPGEQPLLHRGQRDAVARLDDEQPEQLPAVTHRHRAHAAVGSDREVPSGPVTGAARGGQVAASVGVPRTVTQTCAHSAPVPSASTRAIRAGSSSAG